MVASGRTVALPDSPTVTCMRKLCLYCQAAQPETVVLSDWHLDQIQGSCVAGQAGSQLAINSSGPELYIGA